MEYLEYFMSEELVSRPSEVLLFRLKLKCFSFISAHLANLINDTKPESA